MRGRRIVEKTKKSKKQSKQLSKEQLQKREKSAFKRKINSIFTGVGFIHIPTNDREISIGMRSRGEIDSLYIYENIWLICEDTIANNRDHIRTKNEIFGEIKNNLKDYIVWLDATFPEMSAVFTKYDVSRIKVFGLYMSKSDLSLSESDYCLFENITFVSMQTLDYFQWVVKGIKLSARNEIFRFLNLKRSDIGNISSSGGMSEITAPIIYPKEFTGLTNQVRVISFMMSAEELLNTCYVLRKDNWEDSIWLYQRLIDNSKLKKVRSFIENKGEAFYNNIIVALPDDIVFKDQSGAYKTIDQISGLESCQLVLRNELNSICVIDGQHRIFAHYESGIDNTQEKTISELRKKLHLLVTGLVFPKDMRSEERAKIQSEIFLDINSNAKAVPPAVLLQIKRIKNPIADESLAQFVIESLNKNGIFKDMFQMSSLENGKIKTASIVRFALRYLVTINPAIGKKSLYDFWNGDKNALQNSQDQAIKEYVAFCAKSLREYFGAIKKRFTAEWEDQESMLLTVISINGFIMAYMRQLNKNGVNDFKFYNQIFKSWDFDFKKSSFPYTSSQYRKFSTFILNDAFKINDET